MNKVILGLILAVCVLGMALVMLNERLGRKSQPAQERPVAEMRANSGSERIAPVDQTVLVGPGQAPISEGAARELENGEARAALAPPKETRLPEPEDVWPDGKIPAGPPVAERAEKLAKAIEAERVAGLAQNNVRQDGPEAGNEEAKPLPPAQPAKAEAPQPAKAEEPQSAPPVAEAAKPAQPKPARAETPRPAPKAPARAGEKTITRFVVFSRENGATVRLAGNAPLRYKSMTLEDPNRVVIDLDGEWSMPASPGVPKNDLVSGVRVGKLGDKTRIVIDLKQKPRISRTLPAKSGDGLDVRVDK